MRPHGRRRAVLGIHFDQIQWLHRLLPSWISELSQCRQWAQFPLSTLVFKLLLLRGRAYRTAALFSTAAERPWLWHGWRATLRLVGQYGVYFWQVFNASLYWPCFHVWDEPPKDCQFAWLWDSFHLNFMIQWLPVGNSRCQRMFLLRNVIENGIFKSGKLKLPSE